ncbi:hypothetical protein [Sphingomonas sp.]|uniref:hypothetical protein n=1 Tax=Sphingomonas sp. TaxID=28214 RepID=UPI0025D1ED85|nr:hypothetical protein [Sphingomonas sp.]MBV9528333.1 hypothetical protein [Sphingomonas sp.]
MAAETGVLPERDVGGRPSKYDPVHCDAVIAYCATGKSLTAFASSIRVSRRTLLYWAEQHPEFAEATQIAKAAACSWWEDRALEIGAGEGGPGAASMAQFALKNLAPEDFSDRREVSYSGAINHNLTYEQAREEARRRGLPERVLIAETVEPDDDGEPEG